MWWEAPESIIHIEGALSVAKAKLPVRPVLTRRDVLTRPSVLIRPVLTCLVLTRRAVLTRPVLTHPVLTRPVLTRPVLTRRAVVVFPFNERQSDNHFLRAFHRRGGTRRQVLPRGRMCVGFGRRV